MCKLLRWLFGTGAEEPAPEPARKPTLPDPAEVEATQRWIRQHDEMRDRQAGKLRCEECGGPRGDGEAVMHRKMCACCSAQWVEDVVLLPLIARYGRKGARRALKALVQSEAK